MNKDGYYPFRSEAAKQKYLKRYEERAAAWPVSSEERIVHTSFGSTFVRASGSADNPPLIMLPGIGSPGLLFSENTASLSQHFQTFAVDNIHDFGRSIETRPVTGAEDFTSWLNEVFTGLNLADTVNLLGLSYGGWIAARYALRFPDRVRRLVLLAPAGTLAPVPWGFIWRAILCMIPVRFFMKYLVNWMARADSMGPESRRLFARMADDTFVAQRSFKLRRMVPPVPLTDKELGNLPPATLILFGDQEVVFDPHKALSRLRSVAPQVQTGLIQGAGHGFFMSCADEVNGRVTSFLNSY